MMSGAEPLPATPARPLYAQHFRASLATIRAVLLDVEARVTPANPDLAARVELALAEVLNNVRQHGCPHGPARVSLRLCWQGKGLSVWLADDGRAIPPECLVAPKPPPPPALPEGGFGWPLVHQLVTDLRYRRREGYNLLNFRVPP